LSTQLSNGEIYLLDSLTLASLEYQLAQIYGENRKKNLIKLPETQNQDNSIECGLFSLINAVVFCQSGFKGGTHIKFEQKYMREHLVHCLEKGNFSAVPKNHVGFAPKNIKINTYKIEIDCECGKPNTIENMIGCEGIKGKKNIAMYGSIGLVQET
jgi:hypothetical protein